MSSPAVIIRQLLLDLGLGTASGEWPIFVSFFPGEPDEAICVYDTAGRLDGRIMATGEQVEHKGIQITVRGQIYPDVWDKMNTIVESLDVQRQTAIAISAEEVYVVAGISRTGAVLPVGVEEVGDRRRHLLTMNAVITVRNQ